MILLCKIITTSSILFYSTTIPLYHYLLFHKNSQEQIMRTSTLVAASAGTILTGLLGMLVPIHEQPPLIQPAYAVYFDHKRQTDPDFRRSIKRNNRRVARVAKEEAEAHGAAQREAIKKAVNQAKADGFPTDLQEKEGYFMGEVAKGESLIDEGAFPSSFLYPVVVVVIDMWMILMLMLMRCCCRPHRGCSCLLQGSQGLSSAQGSHCYLR